jgi:F0F1-type ATP synthase assembly protein I
VTSPAWGRTLAITIGLQGLIVVSIGIAAGVIAGRNSAWSGLAGGAAVAVPNAILAAYLWLKARHARVLSATTFLAGELVKLLGTLVALYLVAHGLGARTSWPALVVGVIGALKAQWLAVWFTRND